MKKLPLFLLWMALAMACGSDNKQQITENEMKDNYLFLLGTYTGNDEQGINLVQFDPEEEVMKILSVAAGVKSPSFVISNKNENLVFAVEESGSDKGGKVSSFKFDRTNSTFERINSVFTGGNGPCHVSLDPSESFLVVSNYSGGSVTAIPVDEEGNLSQETQVIQHEGGSINPGRQKAPHVHSAVFHPTEKKVFVADLGTDKIYSYDFDKSNAAPLSPSDQASFAVEPGAGPRHIALNESGDRLYLIHEMTAEVGVYSYQDGELSHLETQSLLPEGFTGEVGASEVRISPDGKFLYASNRGEANDITVFEINGENGQLNKVQNLSSEGIAPRNFAITADGRYLICGNQTSEELIVFDRDKDDGRLTPTSISLSVNKPVYLYFLKGS